MNATNLIIEKFITGHPVEAAKVLEQMDHREIAEYLNGLSIDRSLEIIMHMDRSIVARSMKYMHTNKAAIIIEKLPVENSLILLGIIEEKFRKNFIDELPGTLAQKLTRLLSYPKSCVAAYMDTSIMILYDDLRIEEALKILKKESFEKSFNLFIVNRDQVYKGIVPVQDLYLASKKNSIASLKLYVIETVLDWDKISEVVNNPGWEDYCSLPVVNQSGLLLGALNLTTLRSLEKRKSRKYFSNEAVKTGIALADLYRIALFGLFRGGADSTEKTNSEVM